MIGKRFKSRWLLSAVILAAAECAAVVAVNVPFVDTAQAQFFRDTPSRPRPQRSGGFFDSLFGPSTRQPIYEGEPSYQGGGSGGGGDNSRAPSPRKADKGELPPTTSIVVMGDGMADWLAYGLEDAFSDAPEIGIIRKNKARSGLLRYDVKGDLDWWHVARDILAQEKPNYVIMMLGVSDRDNIRERDIAKEAAKEAAKKEAEKKEAEKKKAGDQADKAAADKNQPGKTPDKTDADKTAQTQEAAPEPEDADQPAIIAPEQPGRKANGIIEFRTEKWAEIYSRRIDETIAALKSKGVPVFWVGLPAIKGPKSTADAVYLNDLYRGRAERAGAIYIDVWDGFVDEGGKFTTNGPDYEGQVRKLRSADGVYFTKYGARKLAHYVERELRRYMSNRSLVSLPSGPVGPVPADGKSAVRPLAGPVVPLTVTPGNSDELLGGAGNASARGDAIATQVLVKGEPVAPAAGRADDFAWRQGNEAVAPAPPAVSNVTPASAAPAASAYTEPEVQTKKPAEPKNAPAAKTAQAKKPVERKPAQAPQHPPRAAQSNNPFGGLFR